MLGGSKEPLSKDRRLEEIQFAGTLSDGVFFEKGLWQVFFGMFILPETVMTFILSFFFFFAVFAAVEPDVLAYWVLWCIRGRRRRRMSSSRRLRRVRGSDDSLPEERVDNLREGSDGSIHSSRHSQQEDLGMNSM